MASQSRTVPLPLWALVMAAAAVPVVGAAGIVGAVWVKDRPKAQPVADGGSAANQIVAPPPPSPPKPKVPKPADGRREKWEAEERRLAENAPAFDELSIGDRWFIERARRWIKERPFVVFKPDERQRVPSISPFLNFVELDEYGEACGWWSEADQFAKELRLWEGERMDFRMALISQEGLIWPTNPQLLRKAIDVGPRNLSTEFKIALVERGLLTFFRHLPAKD